MKFATLLCTLLTTGIFLPAVELRATVAERPMTAESLDTTLTDAHRIAARHAGVHVVRVEGRSMLPFFGEGSVLVVKSIAAADLRSGMVVVYKNRFGETVAHRLVSPSGQGWIAQGYNNAAADSTLVKAENLIGVVYATLHSNGHTAGDVRTADLLDRTMVAWAAPAR